MYGEAANPTCCRKSLDWAPEEEAQMHQALAADLSAFGVCILSDNPTPITFNGSSLRASLKSYNKDALGVDMYNASELRKLPVFSPGSIAHAMELALNTIGMPHPNLLSLNAVLGKTNGDCRTICKTPLLHRMVLRAGDTV